MFTSLTLKACYFNVTFVKFYYARYFQSSGACNLEHFKTRIKGILIGKEETKLLQYADDTTAVLSDRDSAYALFNLLDVFRKLSGLKINTSKTEGMWVGSL